MSKGMRNKQASKKKKLNQSQIEAMARILEATQFTRREKIKIRITLLNKRKISKLISRVYGYSLRSEPKKFRKIAYNEYAISKIIGDFSDFHLICITKCAIMDNRWNNYLTEKGGIK